MTNAKETSRTRVGRPSPALVISIIALFVALGGTGYAINTIDSSDVVNNSLIGKDVKNRSLTGKDVKPNSLRGGQIKESALSKVPSAATADNAATAGSANTANSATTAGSATTAASADSASNAGLLDGMDSLDFGRVRSISSSEITEAAPLTLTVAGYGTYHLFCDDNGTPATANDDFVSFGQTSQMGVGAIEGGLLSAAGSGTADPTTRVIAGTYAGGGGSFYTTTGDRLTATFRSAQPGTGKAIVVEANGHENNTSATCHGEIQALLLG